VIEQSTQPFFNHENASKKSSTEVTSYHVCLDPPSRVTPPPKKKSQLVCLFFFNSLNDVNVCTYVTAKMLPVCVRNRFFMGTKESMTSGHDDEITARQSFSFPKVYTSQFI
jgi:hypothetical protein